MEEMIKNANFLHDDEEAEDEFGDKLGDWISDNREECTRAQVCQAMDVLAQRLLGERCPVFESHGWEQARLAYNKLGSLASDLVSDEKMKEKELQELCLKQMMKFHRYGPATIHGAVMKYCFRGRDVDLPDYIQTLQGEDLMHLVSSVCTPIAKKEDTDLKEFYQQFRYEIKRLFDEDFKKEEVQKKEYMDKILNYAMHLYLDYSHVPEEGYVEIGRTARVIFDYFKDEWQEKEDVQQLKAYLKKLCVFVKKPGFPQNEAVYSNIKDIIHYIREKIRGPGSLEKYSSDMIELLECLSQCKTDNEEMLFEVFKAGVYYFRDNEKDYIKNQISVFLAVAPPFKKLLATIDMKFLIETYYIRDIMCVLEKAYGKDKKHVKDWLDLGLVLLHRPCDSAMRYCRDVLDNDTVYKWKDHSELADRMFQAFTKVQMPKEEKKGDDFYKSVNNCIKSFMEGLKKSRILKNYGEGLMYLSLNMLELKEPRLFDTAEDVAEHVEINVKEKKASVMEVMNRLHIVLKDDDLPWHTEWVLERAIADLLESLFDSVEDGRIFTNEDLRIFVSMCATCLSHDGLNPEDNSLSAHFSIALKILNKLLPWLGTTKRMGLAMKLIPLFSKFYEEEDENLCIVCARYYSDFAQYEPATLIPYFEQLLKIYLDKEDTNILRPINLVYPVNPGPLVEHFQELMSQLLDRAEREVTMGLTQLFNSASRKQPELFTDQNIDGLIKKVKNDTQNQLGLIQILQELCKRKPETMVKYIDRFMAPKEWNSAVMCSINDMVCCLALNQKSTAEKVIDFLLKIAQNGQDEGLTLSALNSMRLVGFKYPSILKQKRAEIQKLQLADPHAEGLKKTIIDMIDGKTPNDIKRELEERQQEFNDLVNKVEEVEIAVVALKEDVDNQGEELKDVKSDVAEQGQRLHQVEETVDETVTKVEEIDNKTLSHAPYWSRDISKLLNVQSEHDWRLLSSRLGYSNDDVRGWAQQADPCMAMLNEWYATRKTSEATQAVLTHLQEMDRLDAAVIVENAMKNAEAVVEDEEFEYASPPPVFISYQWGHQQEVKLLKKHLEMSGYECWLDIGQMGGGDKLFEKIDNGIRAAKVVISCVTNKYTKSPNCNREVNLSTGLHKPIIPLLLEQCPWPPPGSMGPIFSESLFIRFFQRQGEETTDQRYWPQLKFLELLMQLNMNGLPPDEAKIQPEYKNWWMPIEDDIKIDKNRTKDGGQASQAVKTDTNKTETESPEVFISYQWGKQKNIIKLYERLTSLGFNCWLDIKQMGGGDSLYDKIDKGIRGSKVVLSCVTQKYALSANCRREVSLADALKRPMIPLLLELMPWPPPGPMSMAMTQLLYIGFTQEEQQADWQGSEFEELIHKLRQHIPGKAGMPIETEKEEEKSGSPEKEVKGEKQSLQTSNKPEEDDDDDDKEESKLVRDSSTPETEPAPPVTAPETFRKPRAIVKPIATEPATPPDPSPPPLAPQSPRNGNQKKSKSCTVL